MSGSLGQYFAMGGYGAFIWPAYAIVAIVLIALLIVSLRTLWQREAEVARLDAGRERGRRGERVRSS